ncbi:UNVERIFIED_ORG: hypothetical protein ABIB63_001699 [Xanthomonas axonopodis]
MSSITFGMWSTILLLGSAHGVLGAVLLLLTPVNRIANRCLAALLLVVVALITPYTLGYAGAYDAYPDLTYAPLFWELAIGPLVWLYVRQLARQQLPPRWALHLLPALLQGAYYTWLFTWPLQRKWAWNAAVQVPWIAPLQDALVLASLAVYLLLAWREYLAYQRWLEHHSSAREELRLPWLRGFLLAASLLVALRLGFTASDRLWHRLSYFDEFPRYLATAALVYYLGLEGWRHARAHYPQRDAAQVLDPQMPVSDLPAPHLPTARGAGEGLAGTGATRRRRSRRARLVARAGPHPARAGTPHRHQQQLPLACAQRGAGAELQRLRQRAAHCRGTAFAGGQRGHPVHRAGGRLRLQGQLQPGVSGAGWLHA